MAKQKPNRPLDPPPRDPPGELAEEAVIILKSALARLRAWGFGVVADGTEHGDNVWVNELRPVRFPRKKNRKP